MCLCVALFGYFMKIDFICNTIMKIENIANTRQYLQSSEAYVEFT